jgi:hypothetical protein
MAPYSLQVDGDGVEQHYYDLFIAPEFPEYGHFWAKHVPPLTNRPNNIHFKDDQALIAANHTAEDICIAQLHYSILRHLARVYEVRQLPFINLDFLTEVFVRLTGAQDIAFEMLERYTNRARYDPWVAAGNREQPGSREAKQEWQRKNSYPLQNSRDYRNHLVHGRMLPSVAAETYYFPSIGHENQYFDWRAITGSNAWQAEIGKTLLTGYQVAQSAWDETLGYFRTEWNRHLLP